MDKENTPTPKPKAKIVQTYADDMATVIGDGEGSLIKNIIHGEEENEKEKIESSPETKKNRILAMVSLVLVFLSVFLFIYVFIRSKNPNVSIQEQFTPLIFNDKSVFLEIKDLKKDELVQTLYNESLKEDVKKGGVKGIYLVLNNKIVGLREFIKTIKGNFVINDSLDGKFISENFLSGVFNGEKKGFFILLKMRSIPDIFDSLRLWERKMFSDLQGFIGVALSSETKDLFTKDFEDGVIYNKNARILYDSNGELVLMYVFANDNSVIISNSKDAVHEIVLRLASGQIKK